MQNNSNAKLSLNSLRVKIQEMGGFLSAMVMPNIGVFIAWGLLAAFFIPTGWFPNARLNGLVAPLLKYLMPVLIGYVGGFNVYGKRGGAIGALATMGVVIGSHITMLIGGMVMGPLAAWLIKKFDKLIAGYIKPGLEMLVDNFSLGIIGFLILILGFLFVEPLFSGILALLSAGVQWLMVRNLIPLTSILVQPAQVLFLNNAINHGIMVPIGLQQVAATGKSILFMVEANGGTWTGLLLAFSLFGQGVAKRTAPASALIMFFGGIGEIAFPYALIKPITILGPMFGNIAALWLAQIFHGGTVGAVSPGSFLALVMMSPKNAMLVNIICYFVALVVSFLVVSFFLKLSQVTLSSKTDMPDSNSASSPTSFSSSSTLAKVAASHPIQNIIIACDAGMGSSAMGASMLSAKVQKAHLPNVHVQNVALDNIPNNADLIITSDTLFERVKDLYKQQSQVPVVPIKNYLDNEEYEQIIQMIQDSQ